VGSNLGFTYKLDGKYGLLDGRKYENNQVSQMGKVTPKYISFRGKLCKIAQ